MSEEKTETLSRWVWYIARLAMNQPHPRTKPKVGDIVVETTHLFGTARHKLGRHKAIGEVMQIENVGEDGERVLIKSLDPEMGETWWSNAMFVVIEPKKEP